MEKWNLKFNPDPPDNCQGPNSLDHHWLPPRVSDKCMHIICIHRSVAAVFWPNVHVISEICPYNDSLIWNTNHHGHFRSFSPPNSLSTKFLCLLFQSGITIWFSLLGPVLLADPSPFTPHHPRIEILWGQKHLWYLLLQQCFDCVKWCSSKCLGINSMNCS